MKERKLNHEKLKNLFGDDDIVVRIFRWLRRDLLPDIEVQTEFKAIMDEIDRSNERNLMIIRGERPLTMYDPEEDYTWLLKRKPTQKELSKLQKLIVKKGWGVTRALRSLRLV